MFKAEGSATYSIVEFLNSFTATDIAEFNLDTELAIGKIKKGDVQDELLKKKIFSNQIALWLTRYKEYMSKHKKEEKTSDEKATQNDSAAK